MSEQLITNSDTGRQIHGNSPLFDRVINISGTKKRKHQSSRNGLKATNSQKP